MEIETLYQEKKLSYDKVAVSLEMEKQALEKECALYQEEALREESKYHYIHNLINMSKIKLERCEQEKKWQGGQGRMMRDFASLRDLYAVCHGWPCVCVCFVPYCSVLITLSIFKAICIPDFTLLTPTSPNPNLFTHTPTP
ncbi:hypothetical protein EON63_14775 [archaeon]|nr:MAG: hypothetical protein EON63_14775 [archaeon]